MADGREATIAFLYRRSLRSMAHAGDMASPTFRFPGGVCGLYAACDAVMPCEIGCGRISVRPICRAVARPVRVSIRVFPQVVANREKYISGSDGMAWTGRSVVGVHIHPGGVCGARMYAVTLDMGRRSAVAFGHTCPPGRKRTRDDVHCHRIPGWDV